MIKITVDFETQSRADLKKVGAYEYSMHPTTIATCLGFKLPDARDAGLFNYHQMQKPFSSFPKGFQNAFINWILNPDYIFSAHNAYFEQCIFSNVLSRRFGWPKIPIQKFRCTAAKAASVAIPRSLDGAGRVMNLTVQKSFEGHRIMLRLCKPTAAYTRWKKEYDKFISRGQDDLADAMLCDQPPEFWTPETAPEDYQKLYDYCKIDVLTEEKLDESLPDLTPLEQKIWFLDQKINFRGVAVDMPVVNKISGIMASEAKIMNKELDAITTGLVSSGNARNQILEFLDLEGIQLPDLKAKTVDDFLANGKVSGDAKTLLEIRRALSKASTAKYQKFIGCAASDGRVRDLFLYHGASTGRWGGKNVQPQNFPRGIIKDIDEAIYRIKTCELDILKLLYGENLMPLFSSVLRGMFIASPGYELFVEDYSAIETRVVFWLADHQKGLDLFRNGSDPYKVQAVDIFKKSILEITDEERQVGKAAVLGCIAEGSLILTRDGYTPIEKITTKDLVWNGENWVKHEGLLIQGPKPVIDSQKLGFAATPDHRVLTTLGWRTLAEIEAVLDTPHLKLAEKLVGPLWSQKSLRKASNAVSRYAAFAELLKNVESISFGIEKIFGAGFAQTLSTDSSAESLQIKLASFLIENIERVGSLVSIISGNDAKILQTKTLKITAVAAYDNASNPVEIFWNTLLRCAGLISSDSRWTELITTGTMSPETYASLAKKLITRTAQTYDLKNVEFGNRYLVQQQLVHNCGYQMGPKKFMTAAWDVYRAKVTLDLAKVAVTSYRTQNYPVTELWSNYEQAAMFAVENPGAVYKAGKCRFFVKDSFLWVELPSRRRLAYKDPEVVWEPVILRNDEGEPTGQAFNSKKLKYYAINHKAKKEDCPIPGVKWTRESTYGGKLTENIVQAVSRDLLAEAMLRAERAGFRVLMHAHDELVSEAPINTGTSEQYRQIMETLPAWAEGLPLKASGWTGLRYKKG